MGDTSMQPNKETTKSEPNVSAAQKIVTVIIILPILAYYSAIFIPTIYGMPNLGIFCNFGQSFLKDAGSITLYLIGLISAVFALIISFMIYKKLNNWDKSFKISVAMYIFMIISFATNAILSHFALKLFINSKLPDDGGYVSYEPMEVLWLKIFVNLISSLIALVFVFFYARVDKVKMITK